MYRLFRETFYIEIEQQKSTFIWNDNQADS